MCQRCQRFGFKLRQAISGSALPSVDLGPVEALDQAIPEQASKQASKQATESRGGTRGRSRLWEACLT
ncbi:hypothetical protein [Lamprobacter modestohalophilus]|uniref:hypothetical protein n=1 Tax=Lamprobacter modestohalophilus TaxID=1064514 RepID=UPI001903C8B7|nr:hypothetical protein [Lamprobacter modestohalophilus]